MDPRRDDLALLHRQHRRAITRPFEDWHYFQVTPTVPPSTTIRVLGGPVADPESNELATWTRYPSFEVDLADPFASSSSYWRYSFSQPGAYICMVVALRYAAFNSTPIERPLYLYGPNAGNYGGGFVEYRTAAEAEQALLELSTDRINFAGLPLCRLILRGYGGKEYMPIDPINRGRSYLWGDARLNLFA